MAKQGKFVDIIVSSVAIRDEIYRQMKANGMTVADLYQKVRYYGHNIDKTALYRYLGKGRRISQRDVMFLCKMFGISVEINVYLEKVDQKTLKGKLERLIKSWENQSVE